MNTSLKTHPLVSVILLTYNQEKYIGAALEGLLSQDYANLEYIISDDCSRDMTCSIIQKIIDKKFTGKKVIFNKNEHNLGLTGNFNKALTLIKGDYIVLAAGDDVSLSHRVSLSLQKILELEVDSLAVNFQYINADGERQQIKGYDGDGVELKYTLNDYIERRPLFPSGPSRIISKRVFDVFGMLREDCPTEDTTLTFRSLLLNGVAMVNNVGVLYRWHGDNISSYESLMNRINPVKIYKQYRADLELAYNKGLVTKQNYQQLKRIIWDYKYVQVFERQLYRTESKFKRHILGLLFVANPYVLKIHKSRQWLRDMCPELFIVKDRVKCILKK